jgi:hypothetical protein
MGQADRKCYDADDDQDACSPTQMITALVDPLLHHRPFDAQFNREGVQSVLPEEWIEHAWATREQFSGVQGMTSLRNALAQLVGSG